MKLSSYIALTLAVLVAFALPTFAGETDATVYVGHGIFGGDLDLDDDLPVDIEVVDVGCILPDFRFGDFAGPLTLPAGTYEINIRLSDGACGGDVAIPASVPINMMENVTILAHLDANGAPTASKFGNNVSASATGNGRISAHHAAAAPAVDVWARMAGSGSPAPVFTNVINGQQGAADIPAGKWSAALRPAGDTPRVLGPARVGVQDRALVNVYAVGSLSTGSLTFLVQRLETEAPSE